MIKVSVFGNPDFQPDALPLKILPLLKVKFPDIGFKIEDPNELGLPSDNQWLIIDTVFGLNETRILSIDDLKTIDKSRVSMHDFDLGAHLLWVKKLKKDIEIKIIGVPPMISEDEALSQISKILATLLPGSGRRS